MLPLTGWPYNGYGGRHPIGESHITPPNGQEREGCSFDCGVIVGVGNRGDGEPFVLFFELDQRVNAS